jgi:DNA-directed RNA polymerase specialized sigma24 family protein
VTKEEFVTMYEANYTKALNAARRVSPAYAEDAVSDAAVYLIENLSRFQQITPSYFIQACVSRAKNQIRNQHHDTVLPVGTVHDLALVEHAEVQKQTGRAYNSRTGKGAATGDVLVNLPGVVEREADK